MPQQVRMWEVTPQDSLVEIASPGIDLEDRLEDWLESDISMLDPNLLVIGRQVRTDFGGEIDLLCLDSAGDLVVVELKRGQTPREVTTQALDYASWAKELSFARILEIADGYLTHRASSLEAAFATKFRQPLPDILNESHSSLIVAESMDAATERIVRYLSDLHVPINVATVQHFRRNDGREMLAQVFLVEPEVAQVKAQSGARSKRPSMTVGQLIAMAEEKGVGDLYTRFSNNTPGGMSPAALRPGRRSLRVTNLAGSWVSAFFVEVHRSDANRGLNFRLNGIRLMNRFGIPQEQVEALLPDDWDKMDPSDWQQASDEEIDHWVGYQGYFLTGEEVDKFTDGLRAIVGQ